VKLGDLVKVIFGPYEKPTLGIFIRDDTIATGEDQGGYPVITRAYVLWDGQIYSTPLEQMELISEGR
jgi:hypothetical protein